jgi:hypothetical protein
MGLFKDNSRNEFWVSPDEVDAFQLVSDPKTEAPEFVHTTYQALQLQETHPWHASNHTLMQLGTAGIAYANDRLAEILRDEGARETRKGIQIPEDVAIFATILSQNAVAQLDYGRSIHQYESVEFTEEVRANLAPDAMLPRWPVLPDFEPEDWQDSNMGFVSTEFMKGVTRAARELHADTLYGLNKLTDMAILPPPPEYSQTVSMKDLLTDQLLRPAEIKLDTAEGLMPVSGEISPAARLMAYQKLHGAYIKIMLAHTGILCPPVLGEGFLPQR